MNIFSEVKEQLTTRQVAESYGLRIRKNGVACCPFHDDRHPSMKVDKNYHCLRRNSVNTQGTAVVNNVNGKKEKEYCNNNVNSRRKNRCRNSIIRKAIKQQGKFI